MRSKFRSALCFAFCGLGLFLSSSAAAQPVTHQVVKGETLWSISEKYFGTPDVWPKLWEMNPFITNPHLLRPGDLLSIVAGEREPRTVPAAPSAPDRPKPFVTAEQKETGILVGKLTNLNARGFLSPEKLKPLGQVRSSDSEKILLSKGDILFVDFAESESIRTGDSYIICRPQSRAVPHIVTQRHVGYLYPAYAKVVLRERTISNVFRAEIQENYGEVLLGDLVFQLNPVPGCLKPLPGDPALRGVVIATKGRGNAFGRNSIVYLDSGRGKGLFSGTLLELVKSKKVEDPQTPLERDTPVYEKTVGRMIVLDSGPETATALVLDANEALQLGAIFRGVSSWMELPGARQFLPSCALE